MPFFGNDFDVTAPDEDDFVKNGASWIRDIKSRLKTFLAVLFDLDTGELKPSVVPSSALKDMTGLVPGTYGRVTVNSKGQVVAGFEAGPTPTQQLQMRVFPVSTTWEVPLNVTRVKIRMWGGGAGGDYSATPGPTDELGGPGAGYVEQTFPVAPGQQLIFVVGGGGGAGTVSSPNGSSGGKTTLNGGLPTASEAEGGYSVGGIKTPGFGVLWAASGFVSAGAFGSYWVGGRAGGCGGIGSGSGPGGGGSGGDTPTAGSPGLVIVEYVG